MNRSIIISAATLSMIVMTVLMMPDSFAESGPVDSGSTAWIAICTALVFIMTPGVALFYGGMLRKQSMTSILAQTLVVITIMTMSWFVVGYSLAFGGDGTIIGSFDNILLNGITYEDVTGGIPELEFVLFQCAFALITAGIVVGACAERIHFKAIALFLIVWSVVVYAPMAHWVWGGGLFDEYFTVRDFAGGTVVHICAATTGLGTNMTPDLARYFKEYEARINAVAAKERSEAEKAESLLPPPKDAVSAPANGDAPKASSPETPVKAPMPEPTL